MNPEQNKQQVVIIGHGYTSRLSLVRAFGMMGCNVIVIAIAFDLKRPRCLREGKPIDCYSKYVSSYYIIPPDEDELIRLLLNKCVSVAGKTLVLPDSDFSAAIIDGNLDLLSSDFYCPNIKNRQGEVVRWMDKLTQKRAAAEVGISVADGVVVNVIKGQFNIPEGIEYPCFVKPLASLNGGKKGLKRCVDEKQLRSVISEIAGVGDVEVLVEDYLFINTEYALLGFSTGERIVIPAIVHTFALAQGGHFGVARTGEIVPLKGFEECVERFSLLMKKIGYVGVFDIDFFECGGQMYFGEINFRFGGSGSAITNLGVNLPGMLLRYVRGESFDDMNQVIDQGGSFVNERMCCDDWIEGYLSTSQFRSMIKSCDMGFVRDSSDPTPASVLRCKFPKMWIKRIAKHFLKR